MTQPQPFTPSGSAVAHAALVAPEQGGGSPARRAVPGDARLHRQLGRHVSHGLFSSDRSGLAQQADPVRFNRGAVLKLPETVQVTVNPRALQEAFDGDGIRARLRLLRARPDGEPSLLMVLAAIPAIYALLALATAAARGVL